MHPLWQESLQLPEYNEEAFNKIALAVFRYQYERVPIYRQFVELSGCDVQRVSHFTEIPFLPISFFKTHKVYDVSVEKTSLVFESSGTTGMETSKHFVADPEIYRSSFKQTFNRFYGGIDDVVFLCLLPSYLERQNSSLVYMCENLIKESRRDESGFFLRDIDRLLNILEGRRKSDKVMLIGVTFALLDLAEQYELDLEGVVVMETGGMKGRREEWTRNKVHQLLKQRFHVDQIHSEYGMTEMLSQGYSYSNGIFRTPPYLKIILREQNDPKQVFTQGSGLVNVIDLANIHSCSFIATDDLGVVHPDGSFEILGRSDHSALRGCSLLTA